MAINQARVLVGDLRSLMMWVNNTRARINPMDGNRCTRTSQLKSMIPKSCKKKLQQKKPNISYLWFRFF
jgi:hypothetical protein